MSTLFPTTLDTFTDPTGTQATNATNPTHSGIHSNANDAIAALEAKVGVNGSAVTTTLDYKLSLVTNNGVVRNTSSLPATAGAGETTVLTGSTGSGTLTLPTSPAVGCLNWVTNISSVSVTVAAGGANTVNNNGTVGSITLAAGESISLTYIATVWYVTDIDPEQQFLAPTGLTGATSASRYVGATAHGAPTSGTFAQGDWIIDRSGATYLCITAGSPGTWQNIDVGLSTQTNDLLSMTWDPTQVVLTGTALAAAATIYLARVPLPYSVSVTNVIAYCTAVGSSTVTNGYLGLYSSAGTLIGSSANQTTNWASGGGGVGLNTLPLAGGPFTCSPVGANDFLWVAFYCGALGGTAPSFHRAPAATATLINAGCTAARSRVGSIAQANGVLASLTPGSVAAYTIPFWAALS